MHLRRQSLLEFQAVHVLAGTCLCIYICIYIYIYACMHACMCVCMCVFIQAYVYMCAQAHRYHEIILTYIRIVAAFRSP